MGGSAVELARLGVNVRVLSTDLALAPWGWWQVQRRVKSEEVHPSLALAEMEVFAARFPRRLAFSPGLSSAIRKTVASFDLLHIHNLWQYPQYAAYRAARRAGVPYIVSPHGALDPYLRQRGRLRKALAMRMWQGEMLSEAALVHVTTRAEAELIADVAPSAPRVVVPCGVYVKEFAKLPPQEMFRRRRLGGYRGPLILFLGRITEKKGLDVLIRAFAHLRGSRQARLAIVGPDDSSLVPKLARLADSLGLSSDVVFLDAVYGDERLAALSAADVWAMSSHTENFGIAVVEAMAAGCPVVTSPGVNLADDIAAAQAGVIADAVPAPFGRALLDLLEDGERRSALGQSGRAFAARFDWSVVAPEILRMYQRAAEVGRSRSHI